MLKLSHALRAFCSVRKCFLLLPSLRVRCRGFGWVPIVLLGMVGIAIADPQPANKMQLPVYQPPPSDQVISFLLQSVDWYHHASSGQQLATDASDMLFLDDNRAISAHIVTLSFDFARSDAAIANASSLTVQPANAPQDGIGPSEQARILALKDEVDQARQNAVEEVTTLTAQLVGARGAGRKRLQAALDQAQSRLNFLESGSRIVQGVGAFMQNVDASQGNNRDLGSVIDEVAQSLPDVTNPATIQHASAMQPVNPGAVNDGHESGILDLISDVSRLRRKLQLIDGTSGVTDKLISSGTNLRDPIAVQMSQLVQGGIFNSIRNSDPSSFEKQKLQLDVLTRQLPEISTAIVALDKQKVLLAVYKAHLHEWRAGVVEKYKQAWKKLILRMITMALLVGAPAVLSELIRRVAERHIRDEGRLHFITITRRITALLAAILIIAVGLAVNLRSFATFFGLLTAGIAVALQNVILASLGYVLLVGKRGIKIGDLIQLSGIAGQVTDISLLQFQVKEFDVHTREFTGNVATFSNSFVFVNPSNGLLKLNPEPKEQ